MPLQEKINETPDFVEYYAHEDYIERSEEVVLEALQEELPAMSMLDIGVGGGRTTLFFADLVKEYIGIDYDPYMIEACQKRFPNHSEKVKFIQGDARALSDFENNRFDFVLFSTNGLDYISPDDRLRALREIYRVGKTDGYFLFASHNLNYIDNIFDPKYSVLKHSKNVKERFAALLWFLMNKKVKALKAQDYAVIRDDMYFNRLKWVLSGGLSRLRQYDGRPNYYIKPDAQIKQLQTIGFKDVKVYATEGQEVLDTANELCTKADNWLHYFCRF